MDRVLLRGGGLAVRHGRHPSGHGERDAPTPRSERSCGEAPLSRPTASPQVVHCPLERVAPRAYLNRSIPRRQSGNAEPLGLLRAKGSERSACCYSLHRHERRGVGSLSSQRGGHPRGLVLGSSLTIPREARITAVGSLTHEENDDEEGIPDRWRSFCGLCNDPCCLELDGRTWRATCATSAGSVRVRLSRWFVRDHTRAERRVLPERLRDRLQQHVLII